MAHPNPDAKKPQAGRTKALETVPGGQIAAPKPPAGLPEPVLDWWDAFWASDVAQAAAGPEMTDLVTRLARRKAMALGLEAEIEESGYSVPGSKGQPRSNPLIGDLLAVDREIQNLEDRLGCNPRARISLGLDLANARRMKEAEKLRDERRRRPLELVDIPEAGEPEAVGTGDRPRG